MQGCGWGSGAARAHWLVAASVASRYALGADGLGAVRPGARDTGSLSRATRSAPKAGRCAPGRLHVLSAHVVCLLGVVGMSMTWSAARCSRGSVHGVLRAPAEGEGGVARAPAEREYLSAAAHDHRSASQRRAPCTGNAGRNAPARQVVSVHVVDPRPRDYEAELDSAALTIRRPADVMTRA